MFIKTRTVLIFAALLIALVAAAMLVEWRFAKFAAAMSVGRAMHNYNGVLGRGVSEPYANFIHQLRTMAESGDTNRLVTVLRRADERSGDIDEVWLGGGYSSNQNDFYRKSIDEILK